MLLDLAFARRITENVDRINPRYYFNIIKK